jgi:hypothetical protein
MRDAQGHRYNQAFWAQRMRQMYTNYFQTLNLRRPASASPFAQPRDYKRVLPSERLSAVFKAEDLEL